MYLMPITTGVASSCFIVGRWFDAVKWCGSGDDGDDFLLSLGV